MFACARARTLEAPRVLIGGLGMGFTLRAALDLLPPAASVIVAELVPALVDWNRGPLGALARHPLRDKRVAIEVGDVGAMLQARRDPFDAVLLDVDNGPAAFTTPNNADLYGDQGSRPGPSRAEARRRVCRLVITRGPPIRATPPPCRLRRDRGTRAGPPHEGRAEAHYLRGHRVCTSHFINRHPSDRMWAMTLSRFRVAVYLVAGVLATGLVASAQTPGTGRETSAASVAAYPLDRADAGRSRGDGRHAAERPALLRPRQRETRPARRTAAGGPGGVGARGRRPAGAGAFRRAHGVRRHAALSRSRASSTFCRRSA